VRVDSHLHVYPTRAAGRADKDGYPIVEFGGKDGVRLSARDGDLIDATAALDAGRIDRAWALFSFELPGLPWPPERGFWRTQPAFPELGDVLRTANVAACALADGDPRLRAFVSAHPAVLEAEALGAHVAELLDAGRAHGVKLHTIGQRLYPADPGLWPTYAALAARGAPVVAHCGPDRHGAGLSTPAAFAPVAEAFPGLPLVLAHLGGGAWRDVAAFAHAYPRVRFDLSEIVSWTGSEVGPSADELVALIREIGVERVLMGSDFPWYEPSDVVAAVLELPGLGEEERALLMGGNAAALVA
jgi:uncharacterized protein